MNIDEHIKNLKDAQQALESAPQKGFVDLDLIGITLKQAREFLEEISPRLSLGIKLTEDFRKRIMARLRVLKMAGGGALVSQAEKTVNADCLDYEFMKSIEKDIEDQLDRIFGGYIRMQNSGLNKNQKLEDFH
ncbi:MAG: hypothetical protein B6D58_03735 [candidate division Zixibacteria bacterium 4484_95]|nr:MAG: hypothetical protein B6D58_03735 [candidate division Zixibacteria bacterium 4484_95]